MTARLATRTIGVVLGLVVVTAGCSSKPKTAANFCALATSQQTATVTFSQEFSRDKPADLEPVVQKALAQLSSFDDAAPSAISTAVHTYVTDERNFLDAVKANGYDVSKSTAAIAKAASDPTFQQAGQQLSAYLTNTCHLAAATVAPTATPVGG